MLQHGLDRALHVASFFLSAVKATDLDSGVSGNHEIEWVSYQNNIHCCSLSSRYSCPIIQEQRIGYSFQHTQQIKREGDNFLPVVLTLATKTYHIGTVLL